MGFGYKIPKPCHSITELDAYRLRRGLDALAASDPARAARVRQRARDASGTDDELCPALDPDTRTCDLYTARPITCRTFGPPVRCGADALGVCELCFDGASEEEIAACEVEIDPDGIELELLREIAGAEMTVASAIESRIERN